jgi:glycosyltransferase involved in cell wall biosynthesis
VSSNLRVAVDASVLAWGWSGIPKYVHRIVRELATRDDVEITLLANTRRWGFSGIEGVNEVVARRPGGGLWRNEFASRWLARERPDVFWAPAMVLPRRLAVPSVVTIHDLTPITMPQTKSVRGRLEFRTIRESARRAERLIAVSRWTASELERVVGVAETGVTVVPNGVDDQFSPGDRGAAHANVRARWGLEGPMVLAVGTLEPRKGLDVVFNAARVAGEAWQLVLAGALGDHGAAIAAAAATVPRCRRLGAVTDSELVDLYRAAEVVVAPSLVEGFGMVPLEAMACGTPAVIAAGSGALEDVSGPAALVVRDRNPTAWQTAIAAARDRHEELSRAGTALAAQYRWASAAASTLEVLQLAADPAASR